MPYLTANAAAESDEIRQVHIDAMEDAAAEWDEFVADHPELEDQFEYLLNGPDPDDAYETAMYAGMEDRGVTSWSDDTDEFPF